jgi:hypothetical protein
MEPDPQESEPLVESGIAEAGEEALGDGAASVTVRCGTGGRWIAFDEAVEARSAGAETGRGLALAFACTAGAGARPGK